MSRMPLTTDLLTTARLIVDGQAAGVWNMAVDEALLESAARGTGMTLRLYLWEEATLSLGYFQAHRDRRQHAASRRCPLVRRQTGGGAIVHDRELTYSFCVPPAHPLAVDVQTLYDQFHGSLVQALTELGAAAALCEKAARPTNDDEPFLCFQRRAVGDVLSGPSKIAGSAQRRSHGAVLQHGSILLHRSPAAPELPGIAELQGVSLAPEALIAHWTRILQERLGLQMELGRVSGAEVERAKQLAEEKYGAAAWTERR